MKKILLVGPVYPFRGGISHYTGLMYKTLEKKYEIKMISFKLQYPKFLFRKEQKDYKNDSLKIKDTNFLINTINPVNWIKVSNYIRREEADLVIFQWWHPYFAPCYWSIAKLIGKKTKKLFLCHNVFPHERFAFDNIITKMVLKNGDYFIVHSKTDAKDLKSIVPNPNYRIVKLPTFNIFRFENLSKKEARRKVNIATNEKVLLFFGFVREYKGLKYLIKAMPHIIDAFSDLKLLVVGDFGNDKQEYINLIKENNVLNNINIYDGYIPDREVEKFFASSDLVVLPYESATQSGVAQIAYGFNKPVIATNVGGLPEVVIHDKTGYIIEPKNAPEISKAVIKFYNDNKSDEFTKNILMEEYKYSWDRMTDVDDKM